MTQYNDACKVAYESLMKAPASAERTLALRALQQSRMWFNAGVVLSEG